jgi:ribose transport system substrate-binding protein
VSERVAIGVTEKLKILVSLPTGDNDFQVEQARSAEQAGFKLGIDLEILYAENDTVNQSTQILKGATAPVFTISSNHVEIGHIQGRQFAALLPDGGSVLYIEGPSHSSSAQQRTSGMLETKPANVQLRTLKGQWTEESARRAVRSWLSLATSQRGEFSLVAAQDDSMAMGARKTFEEISDIPKRIAWLSLPFTGCDGCPKAGETWVRNGLLAATIRIPPLAGLAIDMLANGIQNGIQPPETSITVPASIPGLTKLAARVPSTKLQTKTN